MMEKRIEDGAQPDRCEYSTKVSHKSLTKSSYDFYFVNWVYKEDDEDEIPLPESHIIN
jgi:hypothetical protein